MLTVGPSSTRHVFVRASAPITAPIALDELDVPRRAERGAARCAERRHAVAAFAREAGATGAVRPVGDVDLRDPEPLARATVDHSPSPASSAAFSSRVSSRDERATSRVISVTGLPVRKRSGHAAPASGSCPSGCAGSRRRSRAARGSSAWPGRSTEQCSPISLSVSVSTPSASCTIAQHALAGPGIGHADDRDVGDLRVAVQHVLDLGGRDVLRVADDDVLEPAGDACT